MTATLVMPITEIIHLSGISWQTYETLLEELSDRSPYYLRVINFSVLTC
ncbi:MAG: hypothetical protein QNJ37_21515 [Crocosphaera sp.]|nr:hypothetical protein [Crocosphaera sp.]